MIGWAGLLAAERVERRFELSGLPEGWAAVAGVVLLAGLLLGTAWLYRQEQRAGASPRQRGVLAVLRGAAWLLLAAVWCEPIIATYLHRELPARTLVLVDRSASMTLSDPYRDTQARTELAGWLGDSDAVRTLTRGELAERRFLEGSAPLLKALDAQNRVQAYRFGDRFEPLHDWMARLTGSTGEAETSTQPTTAAAPAEVLGSDPPAGLEDVEGDPATDLGQALRAAVSAQGGTPIAAVVVVSDGQINRGEPAEVLGAFARGRKIPVFAVGVGDPAAPRNVAVRGVEAPPNVFVKDPFKVTVQLEAEGLAGESVTVELRRGRNGAEPTEAVASQTVGVGPDGRVEPIVFNQQSAEADAVRLQVRALPVADESAAYDNVGDVTVRALDNKMRVLLVAGGPSWEYRYLARLLERDATVDVSCWLQSADTNAVRDGNTVITEFPATADKLPAYDCIILVDPSPDDFDESWPALVEGMIANQGCGLLYVAGRTHTPDFVHQSRTRNLLNLLPVVFNPGEADLLLNELGLFQTTAWPVEIPPEVLGHPVLALSDLPAENQQTWSQLAAVYWHYPVLRAKPVATVLLRHSSPRMRTADGGHVLLATQFVGSGRTGFLGFDSTWRWRRYGDVYFNKFWIQLIRHLVEGKLLSGQKRGLVQLEPARGTIGEPITIEARLLDGRFQPLESAGVSAMLLRDGEPVEPVELAAQPTRPGWFRGRFVPGRSGRYAVRIDLPGEGGGEPARLQAELTVGRSDLEFRRAGLDRENLEKLAELSAGGAYVSLGRADELAGLIPNKTVSLVLSGEPIRLWDRWWTLAGLVGLLGLEWALRKRFCLR